MDPGVSLQLKFAKGWGIFNIVDESWCNIMTRGNYLIPNKIFSQPELKMINDSFSSCSLLGEYLPSESSPTLLSARSARSVCSGPFASSSVAFVMLGTLLT